MLNVAATRLPAASTTEKCVVCPPSRHSGAASSAALGVAFCRSMPAARSLA